MHNINLKHGQTLLIIALSIVGALLVFRLGEFVGFHKARFSFESSEGYFRFIEGDDRRGMLSMPLPPLDLPGGHGAVGRIVASNPPYFVVASPDNAEKTVQIGSTTIIRKFKGSAMGRDIQPDEYVTVLGNPDSSGRIQAKFIRILPNPNQ